MIKNKNILITGGNSGIGFFAIINLLKTKNILYNSKILNKFLIKENIKVNAIQGIFYKKNLNECYSFFKESANP